MLAVSYSYQECKAVAGVDVHQGWQLEKDSFLNTELAEVVMENFV